MSRSTSVTAPDEVVGRVQRKLEEDGPISHRSLYDTLNVGEDELQRAVNYLWREGKVYHTVDRKFAVQDDTSNTE